ncbi:MAG: hypothetical protein MI725_17685 [Pirellulales bacterium]|nr:hypothetical protein [Pirellulales bacterium]
MSLYHAQRGARSNDTGKFRSRSAPGAAKSAGGEYRGWFYSFVTHETGSSVRRTSYAVSISDPNRNRVEYLRGFASIAQAEEAAREWIDQTVGRIMLHRFGPGHVGAIPAIPESNDAQVK